MDPLRPPRDTIPRLMVNFSVFGRTADELYKAADTQAIAFSGDRTWRIVEITAKPHLETQRGVESWEADVVLRVESRVVNE